LINLISINHISARKLGFLYFPPLSVATTNLPVPATPKLKKCYGAVSSGVAASTATKQARTIRGEVEREGAWVCVLPTREQRAEIHHGVGEGRGVEDLPGVDLVGPELVGSLHPRRRERGRGRGREGARVRQAAKQARRRREWEWEEQDGTPAQHLLELKPEGPFTSTGRRSTEPARTWYRCGLF